MDMDKKMNIGQMYEVYDLDTETWNGGYEYLGYDVVTRRFFYRFRESYDSERGQTYMFISLSTDDDWGRVR